MKYISKTLTYLALTTLCACLLPSCSKHHKVLVEEQILLGANSVSTKALVSGKQSLIDQCRANGTGFGVYGYKIVGDYRFRVFDNVKVYPTTSSENTPWTYTPTKYWDSNPLAYYQFVAYWPLVPNAAPGEGDNYVTYVTESNSELIINDIPNWQDSINANDFMTDNIRGYYRGETDVVFSSGTVTFTFKHLLAKVVFKACYTGSESSVIKVHSLRLKPSEDQDMPMGDGTIDCTYKFGGQVPKGQEITLTPPAAANSTTFSKTLLDDVAGISLEGAYDDETGTSTVRPKHLCSWLTAPSTNWDNLDVEVSYSIGDTPMTRVAHGLTLNSTVTTNTTPPSTTTYNHTTLSGYQYVITLKLTAANGIEIQSVQVKDWAEGGTFTPSVYNW